jgi:hypothetical protein
MGHFDRIVAGNLGKEDCDHRPAPHYLRLGGITQVPVLNSGDFTCFLQKFAAGCP